MNELSFLNTMIDTVKYDDYQDKEKLLAILRQSEITFDKTRSYTTKYQQFWENIDLRVPAPLLKEARKYQKTFQIIASDIYKETDEYDFYELRIKVKIVESTDSFISNHDVVFDEIKETIIQGIRNAKYIIWAAVAWITDEDIVNELLNKKTEGVNIRIITSDESSNSYLIDSLSDKFDTVKIPCWGKKHYNRMHHKFCIIDFDYVMHGSYNWSKTAQNNEETLSTALDREFVKKFLDEFVSLYKQFG